MCDKFFVLFQAEIKEGPWEMKHRDFFVGSGLVLFFHYSLSSWEDWDASTLSSYFGSEIKVPLSSHLPHVSVSAAAGFVSALYSISRSFVVLIVLYAFCFSAVKVSQKNSTGTIQNFKLEIDVI